MDDEQNLVKKGVVNGQVVEDFDCLICHEVFENPRLLKCGHSFCLKCILSYITNRRVRENSFQCPICRESTIIPVHILHKVNICEDDVKDVMPKNIVLANAIGNLNVEQEFCTHHPNKILEYFCQDHQMLSCSRCTMIMHRTCKSVIDLDDCDHHAFMGLLKSAHTQLITCYEKRSERQRSLQLTKQEMVIKLERLKQEIGVIITACKGKVGGKTIAEMEHINKLFGQPPTQISDQRTLDRSSFVVEMQNVNARKMQVVAGNKKAKRKNEIYEDILNDAKEKIQRKIDSFEHMTSCDTPKKYLRLDSC